MHTFSSRRLAAGAIIVAGLYALVLLVIFPRWTVDDAFISFRYAENLVRAGQLTWNPGQSPAVEGYTGVLWPLLLAGGIALGIPPVLTSQLLGALALLGGGVLTIVLLRTLGARIETVAAGALLYATADLFYAHALAGLETMLFSTLLLAAFLAHLRRQPVALALALLLASLTRPEGLGLMVAIVSYGMYERRGKPSLPYFRSIGLLCCLPWSLYFHWRLGYYGEAYPLPALVKTAGGPWNGGQSLVKLAAFTASYLFLPAAAAMLAPLRSPAWWRPRFFIPFLLFAVPTLSLYLASSLVMDYSYRFYAPLYPLLIIGLLLIVEQAGRRRLALALLAAQVLLQGVLLMGIEWRMVSAYAQMIRDEHEQAAAYITRHLPADEPVIVYVEAGVIGYRTGRTVIDFGGLNDPYLAHQYARQDRRVSDLVDYFYEQRAGAVVWSPIALKWGGPYGHELASAIQLDPRWQRYQLVEQYRSPPWQQLYDWQFTQDLYVRSDLVRGMP